jgi:hypothetical protein
MSETYTVRTGRRNPGSPIGRATPAVAAALAAGVVGGLWLRPADGRGWQALVAAAVLAVTAVLGVVWLWRARAVRRLNAALDAYAAREIARARHLPAPKRVRAFSAPGGVLPGPRASPTSPPQLVQEGGEA